jgi:hypothetical protein
MIFVTLIMFAVQVGCWQMFPKRTRDIMFANPVFAFLINLAGSGLIATFTGVASFVGLCNLGASVLFAGYAWGYATYYGISGLAIDWYKLFGFVPVWPKILVVYTKGGKTWQE